MIRGNKAPAKNSLQLRKNPAKSFSVPADGSLKKKKKITKNKKTGYFKNKDESEEWSTYFTSIEEMRDTALDSECYPSIVPYRLSFDSETELEHAEKNQTKPEATTSPIHLEESFHPYIASTPKDSNRAQHAEKNQTKLEATTSPIHFEESFHPYIASTPKDSNRAQHTDKNQRKPEATTLPIHFEESFHPYIASTPNEIDSNRAGVKYGKIHPRKIVLADICPIKGQAEYGHYFETQDNLEELQPINLSESAEIPEVNDEIVIQDSDNYHVSNELKESVLEFSDFEQPAIPEQSDINEDDLEVPVEESEKGLDLQYQNNSFLLITNKEDRVKDTTHGVKELSKTGSKSQKQNSRKKNYKDSNITQFRPKLIFSPSEVEVSDHENILFEEPCVKTSRTESKTKNTIIKSVTDIYEFHEDSDTLKRNKKSSSKSRKNHAEIKRPHKKLSENARNTSLEKAKRIEKHQDMLKHVPICCLTTLKCSLQL